MISWDDVQSWINTYHYRLERRNSNHFLLYVGGYTVFLNPHNFRNGIPNSKLDEIAQCLGITRNQLVNQINAC